VTFSMEEIILHTAGYSLLRTLHEAMMHKNDQASDPLGYSEEDIHDNERFHSS